MNLTLQQIKNLTSLGLIRVGTELKVVDYEVNISGRKNRFEHDVIVESLKINEKTGDAFFNVHSAINGDKLKFHHSDILAIDGMDLMRLTSGYKVSADVEETVDED